MLATLILMMAVYWYISKSEEAGQKLEDICKMYDSKDYTKNS